MQRNSTSPTGVTLLELSPPQVAVTTWMLDDEINQWRWILDQDPAHPHAAQLEALQGWRALVTAGWLPLATGVGDQQSTSELIRQALEREIVPGGDVDVVALAELFVRASRAG